MPTKNKDVVRSEPLTQTVIAAALGMGLTLLLSALSAAFIAGGRIGEEGSRVCMLLSVALGCLVSAAYLGCHIDIGIVPRVIITTASYMLLQILISALSENGQIAGQHTVSIALSALGGSLAGSVTNFSKSNKSYINKSKRKRAITKRNIAK